MTGLLIVKNSTTSPQQWVQEDLASSASPNVLAAASTKIGPSYLGLNPAIYEIEDWWKATAKRSRQRWLTEES